MTADEKIDLKTGRLKMTAKRRLERSVLMAYAENIATLPPNHPAIHASLDQLEAACQKMRATQRLP